MRLLAKIGFGLLCNLLISGVVLAADAGSLDIALKLPSKKCFRLSLPPTWRELPITERNINYQYSLGVIRDGAQYFVFIRTMDAQKQPLLKCAEVEMQLRREKGGSNIVGPREVRIGEYVWFLIESEKVTKEKKNKQIFKVYEYLTKTDEDMLVEVTVIVEKKLVDKFDVGELYKILSAVWIE
jgi:hypothetical protein